MNLKQNWPIIVIALIAVLGLVLIMSQGSGSGSGTVTPGGLSGGQMASLLQTENQSATAIQEAQIAANQAHDTNIFGLVADVANNNAALSADSLQEQLGEYQAYESALGTQFGDAVSLNEASLSAGVQQAQTVAAAGTASQQALWGFFSKLLGALQTAFTGIPSLTSSTPSAPSSNPSPTLPFVVA